ncbi:MAG: ATP-binding protein [Ruminococcus sp.]|nr:ATP-binding protein [Ruminococcus sp.]
MQERCYGITFTGPVGGGKSFYACCIANALIDRGVKVLVTRLSDLVRNRVQDKSAVMDLHDYELIVLDDIGVESATQTAYNIIDDIYRARIPLIITTNLSLSQLKESNSIEKQRIYDRILQRASYPIKVEITISRLDIARKNAKDTQDILNEEALIKE